MPEGWFFANRHFQIVRVESQWRNLTWLPPPELRKTGFAKMPKTVSGLRPNRFWNFLVNRKFCEWPVDSSWRDWNRSRPDWRGAYDKTANHESLASAACSKTNEHLKIKGRSINQLKKGRVSETGNETLFYLDWSCPFINCSLVLEHCAKIQGHFAAFCTTILEYLSIFNLPRYSVIVARKNFRPPLLKLIARSQSLPTTHIRNFITNIYRTTKFKTVSRFHFVSITKDQEPNE